MALIENPNDVQNMFSKAGKITSEKYIVFQRKDEIFNNRPRYAKGKTLSEVVEKEVVAAPQKTTATTSKEPEVRTDDKKKQPFTKQMSRERAEYQKMSHDQPPPCGYYHPKFSELDRKPHKVFDYNTTLKVTSPRPVEGKHGSPESPDRPVVERFRQERKCFVELDRQIDRKDIFAGRPTPHEKRFETVKTTETWSRIPRTPKVMMNKQLAREDLLIYKKKHYAPDYQPNFEYGRKQLGSCGPSFEKLDVRKDIMVKVPAYNNEAYFEYDKYSRSTKSSLFRTPTAPNFNKMLDREQDGKSLLPSFMQVFNHFIRNSPTLVWLLHLYTRKCWRLIISETVDFRQSQHLLIRRRQRRKIIMMSQVMSQWKRLVDCKYNNNMINFHPKCPRKSTEKYQLCKILPEYQTVPVRENQIKNHDYYHDNQHIWNNDHQSSSNLKVFAQIKEQKQKGEQLIHQREELQTRDHYIMDMQRKVWVNECRDKSLERLNNRKLERIGLQNLSSQKNDVFCDVTVTRPILSSGPLLGRSDLLWNQVNKQSKKQVNMLINPKILAMEEQAYETINNRINKDVEAEQIEQDLKMQNIEKIRQQHIQKHQSNQLTQAKSGIALIRSDQVHRVSTAHSQKRNNIDLVEHTLQQMQSISRPFTVNSNFNETRPRLDQLSRPRQSHHFIVKNPFDRSEFKGLYLAHAAQNNDSVFNNTIKTNSHILKDHAFERSRTSAKLQNMQTKRKPAQQFVDGDEVKDMLDSFERKLHRKTLNNDDD